jgi:hypothetical protein
MEEKHLKEIQHIIEMTIKAVHKDMRKNREGYCFRNTKLLLENYHRLKDHVEYAISSPNDVRPVDDKVTDLEFQFYSDYDEEFLSCKPDLFIESILASRVRTALMVSHIDAMVKTLHDESKVEGGKEYDKFRMFYDIFFNGMPSEEVAKQRNYSISQVYRNTNDMVEKLSVLLWGLNGMRWLV